jgi:hypothetical protein
MPVENSNTDYPYEQRVTQTLNNDDPTGRGFFYSNILLISSNTSGFSRMRKDDAEVFGT